MAVADAGSLTMPTVPHPQFNAGCRLMNISEFLEMVLLELPSESILFAQRISRQFRSVIPRSHSFQRRLLLTTTSAISVSEYIHNFLHKEMKDDRVGIDREVHSL